MNAETCAKVDALIAQKLGLLTETSIVNGELLTKPAGFLPREIFLTAFCPAWRSAEAKLSPGEYAGTMVRAMGSASENGKALFRGYLSVLTTDRVQVNTTVNKRPVDLSVSENWPKDWETFQISLKKTALVYDFKIDDELLPQIDLLITPLIGMAMALIGTETIETHAGDYDGAETQYLATRYERKKINRDACIRLQGTKCAGCGFDFGLFYGPIANGYIEVHHIESLASSGEVLIDPAKDLVPLCPNCHSVVHRVKPPMPIAELRSLVNRTGT